MIDNNGKDLDSVGPIIKYAKFSGAKQFLFVSSAGIYKTTPNPPHLEARRTLRPAPCAAPA